MSKVTVTGIVERAYKNPKNGLCSLLINDIFYSTYKTLYPEAEGKMVEITAEQKGKFWNCVGEPKVLATPATPAAKQAQAGYDARQSSIVLQSSYKIAADLADSLLREGHLNLGTKKGAQFDMFLNYVDEIALRLYRNCINPEPFVSEDVEAQDEDLDPAPEGWNAAEA